MNDARARDLEIELQREASAERPRFSSTRHARIMQAVTDSRALSAASQRQAVPGWTRATWRWVALAASILAAAFLAGWQVGQQGSEEMPAPTVVEMRPDNSPDVPAIDGIGTAVDIVGLAFDEFGVLAELERIAQVEDRQGEIQQLVAAGDRPAAQPRARPVVDKRTVEHWTDLEGDARLLASLLKGSLPLELVP